MWRKFRHCRSFLRDFVIFFLSFINWVIREMMRLNIEYQSLRFFIFLGWCDVPFHLPSYLAIGKLIYQKLSKRAISMDLPLSFYFFQSVCVRGGGWITHCDLIPLHSAICEASSELKTAFYFFQTAFNTPPPLASHWAISGIINLTRNWLWINAGV